KIDELKLELGKIDIPDADYTPLLTKLDELNTSIVDNKVVFPDNQKVSDSGVFSKLAEIEAEIKDIKERMEGTFDTRLTGSNVEDALPVEVTGDYLELIDLLNKEEIREESLTGTSILVEANEYRGFNAIWIQNTTDVVLNFRLFYSYLPQYN